MSKRGLEVVGESGGGGHTTGEDGRGEFACRPEGGRLEVESFVRVAGAEGDDEAHDGGDAGAKSTDKYVIPIEIRSEYGREEREEHTINRQQR